MSEEMVAIIQHYRTRNGRELRVRPVRRCNGCGAPSHGRLMQAEPYVDDWRRTAIEIVVGVPVLLALILGVPFLLWLVGSAS